MHCFSYLVTTLVSEPATRIIYHSGLVCIYQRSVSSSLHVPRIGRTQLHRDTEQSRYHLVTPSTMSKRAFTEEHHRATRLSPSKSARYAVRALPTYI